MVIGTNPMPKGIPNLVKKEILCSANSSIVTQHGCENSTAVEEFDSVPA